MKNRTRSWWTDPTAGEFIIVDGACDHSTGVFEYRGIFGKQGTEFFKFGPMKGGSNNIAEFLAAVHALALCKKRGLRLDVYSDSVTALAWVRDGKANSGVVKTSEVMELIIRAEKWLVENPERNKLIKWDTKNWGENPADYGRKK